MYHDAYSFQVLYAIAFFQLFTGLGLDILLSVMPHVAVSHLLFAVGDILILASSKGIYPTIIVVLVALNKSQVDRYSTFIEGSMRFAAPHEHGSESTGSVPQIRSVSVARISHPVFKTGVSTPSSGKGMSTYFLYTRSLWRPLTSDLVAMSLRDGNRSFVVQN